MNPDSSLMVDSTSLWLTAVGFIILLLVAVIYVVINERRQSAHGSSRRTIAITISTSIVTIGTAVFFVLVTNGWMTEAELYNLDLRVQQAVSSAAPDAGVARFVTWFGGAYALIASVIILGAYLLMRRSYLDFVLMLLATGPGSGLMWMMKVFFERVRPDDPLAGSAGHSFPSGHSFWAVVIYGFIIYLVWTHARSRWLKIAATVLLVVLILLIAWSRIVLNVHWMSDVLGGLAFGLTWLGVCLILGAAVDSRRRSATGAAHAQ